MVMDHFSYYSRDTDLFGRNVSGAEVLKHLNVTAGVRTVQKYSALPELETDTDEGIVLD